MKVCKVCNTEKPLSSFYKNKTYADGLTSKCKVCHNMKSREYYKENIEERKEKMSVYQKKNRGICSALRAKYRASLHRATVKWADEQYIKDLYINAREASSIFGFEFQVDHIVPLQAKIASGLHNQFNLQILTKSENCSKQNKMEDIYEWS